MTGEVSPLGRAGDGASPEELRVSHEDRDRAAELLRVAAGDGRLTAEELDERLEKALTARPYGELAALSRDLPAAPGFPAGMQPVEPKEVIRIDRGSGWAKRDGRWLVPHRIEGRGTSGHVTLDFTEAGITHPAVPNSARARAGRGRGGRATDAGHRGRRGGGAGRGGGRGGGGAGGGGGPLTPHKKGGGKGGRRHYPAPPPPP